MSICIDFEAYYDDIVSLKTLGNWNYSTHPQCEAYLVSVYGFKKDGTEVRYVGHPKNFNWHSITDEEWISHNTSIDKCIFDANIQKDIIPFNAGPSIWQDSTGVAAYLGSDRNLKSASKNLLQKEASKEMRNWMKGKTWEDAVAEGKEKELLDYSMADAELSWELYEKHKDKWPEKEKAIARHTYLAGDKGFFIDQELLNAGITKLQQVKHEAELGIPWTSKTETVLSSKFLAEQCRAEGIDVPASMAEDDSRCQEWEEKYGAQYKWVAHMRDWRKSNTLLKKLIAIRNRIRPDGTMGYNMKYFGAHTGRWSGSDGFNIQNLPREPFMGVDLRPMIIARPGKKFIIADFSQIEPRCLAWITDDQEMLGKIREGFGIYEAHARATMNWTAGNLKKENKELYALAKARVLGLGYGCGVAKFVVVARNMAGLIISLEESKRQVDDFRASNPRITRLWNKLNTSFKQSIGGNFHLGLPSGRELIYRNVIANGGQFLAKTGYDGPHKKLYGGLLCENLVQATARDIMAEAILRLEEAGFPVLFHVHDEVIVEVDENCDVMEDICKLMRVCPEWIEGLPIEVEAAQSQFYMK